MDDLSRFDWQDPFRLSLQLTEEEKAIQAQTARYANERLKPLVKSLYRDEETPRELFQELGSMGILGSYIDGYDCAGVSSVAAGLISYELEKIDSGFNTLVSAQTNLVIYPLFSFGIESLKSRLIPALACGNKVGCFALTEPDHGSDPSRMSTSADAVEGGYLLNGTKVWISNAPIADIFIVWARNKKNRQVQGFVLEKDTPGLSVHAIRGKLGLRTSSTGAVILENVFVPDEHVLRCGYGLSGANACISNARYSLGWGAMGAATACWYEARDYVLQRHQFGRPLAASQLIQKKLADMQTEISIGLLAAYHSGRLRDSGNLPAQTASLLKRNACEKALAVARVARDMLGGNGISEEYSVMRHMCNLEVLNTYEGTSDINALILGHAQTNISAFSI